MNQFLKELYRSMDIKMMGKKILFFSLAFSLCFSIKGQTEAEILDQANKFFKEEKFVDATPLYLRLLSLQPKNIDYNYRYGTCLLFNSNKKQESMRYLKFATESPSVEPLAHFYMGRSYHLNYLFNDAVRSYDKFASLVGQKEAEKEDVSRLIQMCQDGRRLMMNYSEMVVYEKKEIEADKFFRLYDLKDIGGNLLVTADFQTKIDKKYNHTPLIYFPKSATEIYYSSYGEEGLNGKEIYRRVRKPTGGWGEPELVKGDINTQFDEDFAYRSQDGQYLYYCSKGHNSMGGYDVFRAVYDKTADAFLETENMDFAVSSPDDDIFFLVDQNNQNGYFASARQSETGKLFVYKIRVEKLPTQLSIIAGAFESKIKENQQITVEVMDLKTDKLIGNFKSKEDGKIIITFPSGGEYKYIMKLAGDPKVYTQNVNIPLKKNIKPLRQNLVHFMENGQEVVRVLDRFDEAVLEKDDILAALFSDKAQLDPNAQYYDIEKLNILSQQKKILAEISAPNLTLSEVAANLEENANSIRIVEENTAIFEQKTALLLEAEIAKLVDLDKQLAANAAAYKTSPANSMTRKDLLISSKELIQQKEESKDRIEDLLIINQKVQENLVFYQDLKNRSKDWREKSAEINKLLSEDKNAEALQLVADNKVVIKSGMTDHVDGYQTKTSKEINDLNVEITELGRKKYNYETSSKDLQNNIDFLERKLIEGNSKDKEVTKENIALKRNDLNLIKEEIQALANTIEQKRTAKENLSDELAEFMAIENTGKPKTLASYQAAKEKWNQLKNSPNTEGQELLAQAIRQEEDSDLALNNTTVETPENKEPLVLVSEADWMKEINPNYQNTISEIQKNDKLNEEFKAESLLKAERENQAAIQNVIQKYAEKLALNPNDEVTKKNNETLKALLEKSNSDLANYNNKYEQEKSRTIAISMTEATIVQSVDKTYQEIYNYLNEDIVADPMAKLKSLNQHDTEFLTKVEKRLTDVNNQLNTNPNQAILLAKERDLLLALKESKTMDISNRDSKITDIENQLADANQIDVEIVDTNTLAENAIDNTVPETKPEITFSNLSPEQQETEILGQINKDYSVERQQIEASSISETEKVKQVQALNNSLLTAIKTERKKLNKKSQANEIAALNRLEEKTLENNRQLEVDLIAKYEEPEELLNRVSAGFQGRMEEIDQDAKLSELEKARESIQLQNSVLSALEQEKTRFEQLAIANPNNQKIKDKIESIDQLQAENGQLLAANERKLMELTSELALNETKEINAGSNFSKLSLADQEIQLLTQISPNFESETKAIELANKSEIEKTNELLILNNQLISKLMEEKDSYNRSNQMEESSAIDRLLVKTQEVIGKYTTNLADLEALALAENKSIQSTEDNTNETTESSFISLNNEQQESFVLNQLHPTYDQEKRNIAESSVNEKAKWVQLLALDNALLNNLAEQKEKLDENTQQSEIDAIKRIESRVNAEIANNQLNLVAVKETDSELITRLAKDYLRNKNQLTSNPNLTEIEKAKRQLAVDELLVESLEKEKSKFETLSLSNPNNESLKTKVDFIAEVIGKKQNEMNALSSQLNEVVSDNTGDSKTIETDTTNQATPNDVKTNEKRGFANIDELRAEVLGERSLSLMEITKSDITLADLKAEVAKLESYESELRKVETRIKSDNNLDYASQQNQLNLVSLELEEVQTKKRQYLVSIGELEQELLVQNQVPTPTKTDVTLERITKEEKELMAKLDGDITKMKEIRKIEKQLLKLADQKKEREIDLLNEETKETQKENAQKIQALNEIETTSVSQRVNKELAEKRYTQLKEEADRFRELAKISKNSAEKNELLEKALQKEKQGSEILETTLVDSKVASLTDGKIVTLSTQSDLEQRKNALMQEEAVYNSEIKNLNEEIKATNRTSTVEELFAKRNQLENERQLVLNQMAFVDKKIAQIPQKPLETIPAEKKNTELSFQEEVEISSSLEYKEISKAAKEAMFLENEITFLMKTIDQDKVEAQKQIETALTDGNKKDISSAETKIKEIQSKEERLTILKNQLSAKQAEVQDLFPRDPLAKAKIENLLLRGIDPIRTDISNYIPIPENGFELEALEKKTESKEIAVDAKVPTGLMFRVQVGAFSKPVAKDAFQEFNPVTGEKRSNGLTVYMAGFFDKSSSAADAQKTIRGLGYSDAFVVAYCDGERIPLVEGRRLEASKTCAPMKRSEVPIVRVPSPKDTTKLMTRELDYNKGLGAAPAFPVELKKGLFYTVQIGVYNKPVDPGTIKNMTPLITKRLPNGQIRYSAGVFVSIEEAMPKRKEAIEKGIEDAYITAYYGSERISLTEAEHLLQDRGVEIIEKTAIGIVKDVKQRIVAEEKLKEAIVEVEKKRFEEGMGIQLVSKETFSEFPRDMLNRFNKHVSFYFDENDKRLKSVIYNKIEEIPQIHFLRDDVDTLFIPDYKRTLKQEKDGFRKIVFSVENGKLNGDVADFINRLNYRKEYIEQSFQMKVIIHNVPSDSIQYISDQLRIMKIRSAVE